MTKIQILLVLILGVCYIVCEPAETCEYNTCGDCIKSRYCKWCSADNVTDRCQPISLARKNWCHKDFIVDPQPQVNVTGNEGFDKTIDQVKVQLRPQRIKIVTRPGFANDFTISYQPAQDFPLDVYYLLDISYTMKSKKQELRNKTEEIYNQLKNYTNNVRLGIGSFVEKPGFPYVDQVKKDKHVSHAFKNHLPLTQNTTAFISTLDDIEFGANYDDPEAGLDALMQAMMCKSQVGWRKGARRIIVLCTDSTYHSAGDGKAIGAIRPNDMQCHLDGNTYNETMALTYDYPSVSQISKAAREGNFIIIFAAKQVVSEDYTNLAKRIPGSSYAVLDQEDDIINIIKKAYKDAIATAKLTYDLPPFIQLTVDQECDINTPRNCKSTPEQRTVNINASLVVKYCPYDNVFNHSLEVTSLSINDKLKIDLEIVCECDCEKGDKVNSPQCHNAGALQCGVCKCNPGRYGVDCRCNGTSTENEDGKKCKLREDDQKQCSGRGTCICGKCESCKRGYSGNYCEYDDNACPMSKDGLCSNHGPCRLGKCQCDAGWTGEDCSCTLVNDACIAPYSKELCSGNGVCQCGVCMCKNLPGKNDTYSGIYCDVCDECAAKRCKEFEGYVLCNFNNDKSICDEKYNVSSTKVEFKNKTEFNIEGYHLATRCNLAQLENGSYVIFKYKYDQGRLVLTIQREAENPPKANLLISVGSALGLVLLIGILTLIVWKILVDIHDKREYQKFSEESKAAGYDVTENVLYMPPTVNFSNPAFDCAN